MEKKRSLKPLLAGYLCVTIVVILLVGLGSLYVMQKQYVRQTQEDLQIRAQLFSKVIAEPLQEHEYDRVDVLCKELGEEVRTRITAIRLNGEVVGDTEKDPKTMENHANRPEIKQVLENPSAIGSSTRYSTTLDDTLMYVAVAISENGSTAAIVRTSIPITTLEKRRSAALKGVLTASVIGALLAFFAIPWFTIRLKPLSDDEGKPKHRGPNEERVTDSDVLSDE